MKKQIICLCLFLAMLLSGCQNTAEGKKSFDMKHILIIGNSHSVDAFHLLHKAYKEQYPGRKLTLGVLYYSGCSIDKHIDFAEKGESVYRYYKNTNGTWEIENKVTMESVLRDQPWDGIFLQAAKSDLDETLNLDGRRQLEAYVDKYVKTPHQFMWHTSWPSPNDESFFSADAKKPAPDGYKENLINLYGFDPKNQYQVLIDKATTHIFPDETYTKAVCTGTGIMYAHLVREHPQTDIWRDYTHLNDFGRLIAAYSMLTQLTGNPIESISLNVLPAEFRHAMFKGSGDLVLTEEMRATIIDAANYSLQHPFSVIE